MEGDPEHNDLSHEHVGSPNLLISAKGAGAGVSSNVAGDIGGDAKETVQACCVPDRQEVGAEQESNKEESHAEPLDDVVGAEEAKGHIVDISALRIGLCCSCWVCELTNFFRENLSAVVVCARDKAIEVGVDVDDSHDQNELANVSDEAPCSEDELPVSNDLSHVLGSAVEPEVMNFLYLCFFCHTYYFIL